MTRGHGPLTLPFLGSTFTFRFMSYPGREDFLMRSNPTPNRPTSASRPGMRWRWAVVVAVLAYAAVSPAGAQTPDSSGTAAQSSGAGADAQVGFQRKAQLTPQEQLLEGDRILS